MFDHDPLFDRLRREMDRTFRDVLGYDAGGRARNSSFLPLNVWSGEEELLVTAEVPGVDPEKISISVEGDVLSIQAERNEPGIDPRNEKAAVLRREIEAGQFTRTFQLPFRVDSEKVRASLKNGILSVTLPRAAEDRPRRIAVSGH